MRSHGDHLWGSLNFNDTAGASPQPPDINATTTTTKLAHTKVK